MNLADDRYAARRYASRAASSSPMSRLSFPRHTRPTGILAIRSRARWHRSIASRTATASDVGRRVDWVRDARASSRVRTGATDRVLEPAPIDRLRGSKSSERQVPASAASESAVGRTSIARSSIAWPDRYADDVGIRLATLHFATPGGSLGTPDHSTRHAVRDNAVIDSQSPSRNATRAAAMVRAAVSPRAFVTPSWSRTHAMAALMSAIDHRMRDRSGRPPAASSGAKSANCVRK